MIETLPTLIPAALFNVWNKMIPNSIWNDKKYGNKIKILLQSKEEASLKLTLKSLCNTNSYND